MESKKGINDIKYMVSEISLQLLGNNFYSIYGEKKNSLDELASLQNPNKCPRGKNELAAALDLTDLLINSVSTSDDDSDIVSDGYGESKKHNRKRFPKRRSSRSNRPSTSQRPGRLAKRKSRLRIRDIAKSEDDDFGGDEDDSMIEQPQIVQSTVTKDEFQQVRKDYIAELHKLESFSKKHFQLYCSNVVKKMHTDTKVDIESLIYQRHSWEHNCLNAESTALLDLIKNLKNNPLYEEKMRTISANILKFKEIA